MAIDDAPAAKTTAPPGGRAGAQAKETLEDYTLRFAPRSYRRWTPAIVGASALGGIAYMADFSIAAGVGVAHGTVNALLSIAIAAVIIFVTGLPLAFYGARHNIDLDLITRGAGFGYYGSVVTSLVFASFTFIFFATEGSIMAQGLRFALHVPLWAGYLVSTLVIIPLVVYGMKALAKLQSWTNPLWLVLIAAPLVYLLVTEPSTVSHWLSYEGADHRGVSTAAVMLGAGACLSLIGQIGEQIDYLRFMPPRTEDNRRAWWTSVILAGPGWVFFGALKQAIGVFMAVYVIGAVGSAAAVEPIEQFTGVFERMMPSWLVVPLALVLVVLSQVKINVTNAYSGSLAWTNSFTRVTRHYPGRLVFVLVNLGFSLALMEADMFSFLNNLLSFYSNCAMAWVVTVATDIGVNKYLLKLSPKQPEFRRGMLYPVNPVGLTSFLASSVLSIAVYFGAFGPGIQPYSPLVAVGIAVLATPLTALATRGRYYLRRSDDGIPEPRTDADGNPSGTLHTCVVCAEEYERPDMLASAAGGVICSLCLSTDRTGRHILPADPPRRGRSGARPAAPELTP
ncbi:purine-cytosine permease family protein [Streptomyces sp. 8L]|uniref:purine-cytosine permease family protein n=1 Tax=Streptomyces sp. 8L TaxID=2877242 RepID=UPI001CD461CA|nr:allantoin permease [Streptomyces sp. 8L]MCA1218217.1 allantoin permease [Streptomyces sp. 8L]